MMIIHAFINVNPDHRDAFLEKARHVIEGTRTEEGNISYQLCEDAEQPNSFIMVETWKDQAAIAHHQQTAHFQTFMNETKAFRLEPSRVDIYEAEKR